MQARQRLASRLRPADMEVGSAPVLWPTWRATQEDGTSGLITADSAAALPGATDGFWIACLLFNRFNAATRRFAARCRNTAPAAGWEWLATAGSAMTSWRVVDGTNTLRAASRTIVDAAWAYTVGEHRGAEDIIRYTSRSEGSAEGQSDTACVGYTPTSTPTRGVAILRRSDATGAGDASRGVTALLGGPGVLTTIQKAVLTAALEGGPGTIAALVSAANAGGGDYTGPAIANAWICPDTECLVTGAVMGPTNVVVEMLPPPIW